HLTRGSGKCRPEPKPGLFMLPGQRTIPSELSYRDDSTSIHAFCSPGQSGPRGNSIPRFRHGPRAPPLYLEEETLRRRPPWPGGFVSGVISSSGYTPTGPAVLASRPSAGMVPGRGGTCLAAEPPRPLAFRFRARTARPHQVHGGSAVGAGATDRVPSRSANA